MLEKHSSIQKKLLRIVLLTSAVALFLTCAAFFTYEFITYREATRRELTTLGKIIAANSTAAIAFESQNDASEILLALRANKDVIAAALYDVRGDIFARYQKAGSSHPIPSHPGTDGYRYDISFLSG